MSTQLPRTNKKGKNGISFRLSLSGFLFLAVLVVVGMVWSFILGVVVGRGHQPEQVARTVINKVLPEEFPLLTEKNEEVLKGEELEFFDKLKQGPSTASPATAQPAAAKTPPAKPETKPEAKPATAQPPQQAAAKEEIFVFNYQVAALASKEQAQTFLKKLEPGGFKTSVVTASHEGKNWYRVYVHHQGTVESAMALREKLKKNGVNNVLLRSRTPL